MPEECFICYECGNTDTGKFLVINNAQFMFCTECWTVEPLYQELSRTGRRERVRQSGPIEVHGMEPLDEIIRKGNALLEERSFQAAMDVFEQASIAYPEDYRAWAGRAVAVTRRWSDRDDDSWQEAYAYHSIAALFTPGDRMDAFDRSFRAYDLACRRDRLNSKLKAAGKMQEFYKKGLRRYRWRQASLFARCMGSMVFMYAFIYLASPAIRPDIDGLLQRNLPALCMVYPAVFWMAYAADRKRKNGTFRSPYFRKFQAGMRAEEERKQEILQELARLYDQRVQQPAHGFSALARH